MKKHQQEQRGFTLLELLLVLLLIASITLLGIKRYQQYKREADITLVKENVNLIFNALNIYYTQFCRNHTKFHVTMDDLIKRNLLPPLAKTGLVVPQQGYDYQVSATKIGQTQYSQKDIYQLTVSAILNVSAASMPLYQQLLGASATNDDIVYWNKLPTYSIPTITSQLWVGSQSLNAFKNMVVGTTTDDKSCAF